MNNKTIDFSPLIILILCAALVAMTALYTWEKSQYHTLSNLQTILQTNVQRGGTNSISQQSDNKNIQKIEWKLVTFKVESKNVIDDLTTQDADAKKVYASYKAFA